MDIYRPPARAEPLNDDLALVTRARSTKHAKKYDFQGQRGSAWKDVGDGVQGLIFKSCGGHEMAGRPKTKEKEQKIRTQIQQKSKMTREELGGQLLKGIRAEQLDTTTDDALYAKNRLTRLSSLGAEKALDLGFVKEANIVGQLPPRWERLLSCEFTTNDWKNMGRPVHELLDMAGSGQTPKTVVKMNEHYLQKNFYSRCYEDDDTMRLITEAYTKGVEDGFEATTGDGVHSVAKKLEDLVELQRRVIDFLIKDHAEDINPILTLTPRELVDRVTLYFVECDLTKRFYTVPGLAFYIGFATRDEFFKYIADPENDASVHCYILRRAITYIESERVTDMLYGGGLMAGHKLDLATNFNYNDAGKKNDTPQTAITVNNNTLNMDAAPPKPATLDEWQEWYAQEQAKKAALALEEKKAIIDVTP